VLRLPAHAQCVATDTLLETDIRLASSDMEVTDHHEALGGLGLGDTVRYHLIFIPANAVFGGTVNRNVFNCFYLLINLILNININLILNIKTMYNIIRSY
jgi:hypothetical protein